MTRPLAWLWFGGVAVVGALAGLAALSLAGTLNSLVQNFPGAIGASGWVIAGGYVALAVGGLWMVLRLPPRWGLVGGLVLLVLIRVVAMIVVDPSFERDPAAYNRLALGVLEGRCCFDARPMGYPMALALFYAVGLSGKLVTLLAAIAAGPLVFLLGRRLAGERAGVAAVYLYAIWPAGALLTGVLLTEPLYATLLLASLVALPTAGAHSGRAGAAASGLALGLSQWVRATSIYVAPAFVLPLLLRRAWRHAALFGLLMLLPLVPVIASTGGLSTSPEGGWSLMTGTNQEHDGTWNAEDRSLYGSWGDERERLAREEGIRRIVSDPAGFASLAVRKLHVLWASERYGVYFAFGSTSLAQNVREALSVVSMLFYVAVFLAAVVALGRIRRSPPEVALVIVGLVAIVALFHTFVEVQPRYHAYVVPLLVLLAASLFGRAPWAIWRREAGPARHPDDAPGD
jgi:hypothetical protein